MKNRPYARLAIAEREGFAAGYGCDMIDAQWHIRRTLQGARDMLAKSRLKQRYILANSSQPGVRP